MAEHDWLTPRTAVARGLLDTCNFGGIAGTNWVQLVKETDQKGKSYYAIITDRVNIRVYSERFILIDREVFKKHQDARDYLVQRYIKVKV